MCVKQCPIHAIKWVDKRPYWKFTCESCMHCMNICPERAIETAHGLVMGLFILSSTIGQTYLYSKIGEKYFHIIQAESFMGGLIQFMLETIIVFGALLLSYRVFHFLKRFTFFEKLLVYTSLTHLKFWRRYKPS
ncbi:MAG: hypothetical protein JXA77_19185 [Bacteroidales bacterium]|nr:hypothetical protein [Bacteroidales bacterium]MBN2821415.1 hypothetical protein [Bacteroidales bacterium]